MTWGKKIGVVILVLFAIGALNNAIQQASKTPAQAKRERIDLARYVCRDFVLKVIADPGSAKMDDSAHYYAKEQKNGTIFVQPTGRAKNAFGAYVFGTWDCIVRDDGKNIKLVSMKQLR